MSSLSTLTSDYARLREGAGIARPLRARQARAHRRGRQGASSRARSPTTSRRSTPGTGCYAAFLTPKGKMLGDLRILDAGDELLLDTERGRPAGAVQHHPALQHRLRRELHKRTLRVAACCRCSDRGAARRRRRPSCPRPSTRTSAVQLDGVAGAGDPHRPRRRPAVRRRRHRGAARRARPRRRRRGRAGGRRHRAGRVRPPALRGRPRRHRDPPGGRPQRPRGVVHQGLLRRPGDRRPPVLPRQAQPPSARPAAATGPSRPAPRSRFGDRVVGHRGQRRRVPRARPGRAGARAPRGARRARRSPSAERSAATVVELPFV